MSKQYPRNESNPCSTALPQLSLIDKLKDATWPDTPDSHNPLPDSFSTASYPDTNVSSPIDLALTETATSEEYALAYLCDRNPVPMWIFDEISGQICYANHATLLRYGYTREEMLSKTILDLRGPEERVRLEHYRGTRRPSKEGSAGYWRHQTKEEKPIWVQIFSQRLVFRGKPARLVTAPDVTDQMTNWEEQSAQVEKLVASEERAYYNAQQAQEIAARLTSVLEEMSDAFFAVDSDWRFTAMNHNAELLLRQCREELLGKNLWDIFFHATNSTFYKNYYHALLESQSVQFEAYYEPLNTWFEVHAYPLLSSNASGFYVATGLSVFFRDISVRKRIEEEAAAVARERAEAASRQRLFLKEVMYSVTEGKLRLCNEQSEFPPSLPVVYNQTISSSADLATIRQKLREVAADSDFIMERSYDLMSAASEGAMNALRHGHGDSIPASITVHCATEGEEIQVCIKDCGHGIRWDQLPRATLLAGYSTGGTLGQGFYLMLQSVDEVYLATGETGTTLLLRQFKEQKLLPLPCLDNLKDGIRCSDNGIHLSQCL